MKRKWNQHLTVCKTVLILPKLLAVLFLLFVYKEDVAAQCISVGAIPSVTGCPNDVVSLAPTVSLSGATGPSYSWGGYGLSYSSYNAPTTNLTLPSTATIGTFNVTGNVNLITNGDFENGTTGWSTQYNTGFCGPGTVNVTYRSNWCGHGDCTLFYDYNFNSPSGHMLSVDGTTNSSLPRFWYETIHGCGGSGPYIFSCQFKSIARNRDKLVPIRKDERPHVKIFTSSLGMVYDCGYIQGCGGSGWIPISFPIPYIAPTDIIWMEDVNTGATIGNEFVVDDISLVHQDEVTVNFAVNPHPVPVGSIVTPPYMCCGSSFSLTANVTSGCGTGCTYLWNVPVWAPATTSTINFPVVPCSATTSPNAQVFVQNHPYNCTTSLSSGLTIQRPPKAGTISGCSEICVGKSCAFTDVGNTGGGTWSSSNPSVAMVNPLTGVVTALGTGPLSSLSFPVIITYTVPANNCFPSASISFPVTIYQTPVVTSITCAHTTICPGGTVSIGFVGTPYANVTYGYSLPGITTMTTGTLILDHTGTGTISQYAGTVVGTFIFTVSGVNNGHCSNIIGRDIFITVKKPTAAFITTPKACIGEPITLTIQGPSAPTLGYTGVVTIEGVSPTSIGPYTVTIPTNPTSNTGTQTVVVYPGSAAGAGPYVYQITNVSGYGCSLPVSGPTITITSVPNPAITLTSNSPVCSGGTLSLYATCTTSCPSTVSWTGPGAFSATSTYSTTGANYTASRFPAVSGTYSLSASYLGCPDTTFTINVTTAPRPTLSVSAVNLCDATPVVPGSFTITAPAGTTVTYNLMPGGPHTIVMPSGTYNVGPITTPTTLQITNAYSTPGCYPYIFPAPVSVGYPAVPHVTLAALPGGTFNVTTDLWGPSIAAICVFRDASGVILSTVSIPLLYSVTGPLVAPSGAYSVTLTGVGTGGCTYYGSGTIVLVLTSFASRAHIVTAPICSSTGTVGPQTFTAVVPAASPLVSYQWRKSVGGGAFNTVAGATNSTYSYTPVTGDKLYVIATDTASVDTSSIFSVVIYPYPVATTTFDSATICSSDSLTLAIAAPDSTSEYTWTGIGSCITDNCSQFTVRPGTSGTYSVTATNVGGCRVSHAVDVRVLPSPLLSIASDQSYLCAGQALHLYINDPDSSVVYHWAGGGVACTGTACDSAVDTPTVTTTYTVTATNSLGCSATSTITIEVHDVSISSVADVSSACGGGTAILSVVSPDPYLVYSWSGGATACNNSTCTEVTASAVATTVFSVTATDMYGCTATSSNTITIHPLPVVAVNASATMVCGGTSFTLSVPDADSSLSYTWAGGSVSCLSPHCDIALDSITSPTTYTVTATNSYGCVANANVTVNTLLPLAFTIDDSSVCAGSTINLSIVSPLSGITYTWSGGGIACDDADCYTAHDNPASNTIYTITAGYGEGCITAITVPVYIISTPLISAYASDDSVCAKKEVTLSVDPVAGCGYTWSGGNITCVTTNCYSAIDNPTSNTTYTVTATDSNGCVSNTTVTVNMLTPLSLSATRTTVCAGTNVIIYVDDPNDRYTYTWEETGTTGTYIKVKVKETTTYTVTANYNGCQSTATITIYVDKVHASASIDNEVVCSGSLVTLGVDGPDSTYTYSWSGGSVMCGSPDCYVATDYPHSNTTYTLTATDSMGCIATSEIEVKMNVPLVILASNYSVCAGQSVIAHIDDADPSVNYWWGLTSDGLFCLNAHCDSINIQLDSTTVYTVTATDTNGCSNTDSFVIEVVPLPAVSAIANNATVCSGGTINLSLLSPDPSYTYSWSGDGISCTDPSCYVANGSVSSSSTFTVTATNGNGCSSSATVEVNVYPNAIDVTASQLTICPGNSDTISVIGNGGPYTWYGSGITCLNMLCDSIVVNPFDSAVYYVVVTDSNGCIDTAGVYIDISDSCQTDSFYAKHAQGVNAAEEHFIIAPNPNDGVLTVRGSLAGKQDDELITITVYDISGRLMMSSDAQSYNGIVKQSIRLPDNAANGTYMIKIRTAVSEHVMKFTLNR